ncbi:MAG: FAD-dependent thymidylate synthase [Elusimicrobia bacterium GWA2_62_23]|nr:MAG: FAD-dependent thymidylate synthase [Elusimicrobia bacterium GWA2_62_23]
MTDAVLKQEKGLYKVLDKGFVKLIDFMGGDQNAVDSARVSFGSVSKGEALDRKLIEYLLEHGHFSPFEHSVFQFHIKCPIFVARQWMRHRIASYNEVSARYTEVKEEFYVPASFRGQDKINRQGSVRSGGLDQAKMLAAYDKAIKASFDIYKELLEAGAAREMARMVLPVAQYTQFHWTINARSLLNFLELRLDSHAQFEIQQYAIAIQEIFAEKMPWTWEAYTKLHEKKTA